MKAFVRPWRLIDKRRVKQILLGEALFVLLDFLCYEDLRYMVLLQLLLLPFIKEWDRYESRVKRKQYAEGFQELLQSVMTSVQAGYTLENACRAARADLSQGGGGKALEGTLMELDKIVKGLGLGIPVDQLFGAYARETANEDILEFTAVMEIVKATGGNLVLILKRTMETFRKKMETEEEIRVLLSGVIYEKNIMLFMPLAIMTYMKATNRVYMACLYQTHVGHILVTCVLAAVVGCYYWTESMIREEI